MAQLTPAQQADLNSINQGNSSMIGSDYYYWLKVNNDLGPSPDYSANSGGNPDTLAQANAKANADYAKERAALAADPNTTHSNSGDTAI